MSWPVVKLSELCEINIGKTPARKSPNFWGVGYPWLSIADMSQGKLITTTKEEITDKGVVASGIKLVKKGTVLFSFKLSIGKVGITQRDLYTNEAIAALPIIDREQLDTNYLTYALSQLNVVLSTDRAVMGATLNKKKLAELLIPLPPLSEQKRIAAILDKADQLRQKRQQAIALADDFLRSVFLDMFGDLAFNPYDYQRVSLDSLSVNDGIKCGPFGTQLGKHEYLAEGVPLWGIKHVNRDFKVETDEYLSAPKAIALKAYSIRPDDIVMTRKGTVGNCHVYPEHMPEGIMHSDLLRIRVDESIIDPYFLSWQLKLSRDVSHQISLISSGAIMAGINVTKLKNIEVYVPEVTQQIKFREILFKKGELTQKYSQGDLALFDALSQKAFAGEL
ncbi:restriction endonuclease subunit S [Endozoicomonas sp. SESOKO1]|uniref:restriction endonuclease subunit S n=1 Tax=Endozoicomonas sp. SESOKO1 TaxID=2828742 RepID=UPI002147DF01